MSDKYVVVVKVVSAYDLFSTLPNWGNLRLLDSEVLGEHLFDRLRTPLERYSSPRNASLLTLRQSRRPLSLQPSCPCTPVRHSWPAPGLSSTPDGSNAHALATACDAGQLTISVFREVGILSQESGRHPGLERWSAAMTGVTFLHALHRRGGHAMAYQDGHGLTVELKLAQLTRNLANRHVLEHRLL